MKTENGFRILASFSGISQVGYRKSFVLKFSSLATLHVVGRVWRRFHISLTLRVRSEARNRFRGLVCESSSLRRRCSAHFYAWEPCQKLLKWNFHPRSSWNEVFIPEKKFFKIFAQFAGTLMSWLFTREFLSSVSLEFRIRFKPTRFNFCLCESDWRHLWSRA